MQSFRGRSPGPGDPAQEGCGIPPPPLCIKPCFLPPLTPSPPEQVAIVQITKHPKLRGQRQATLGRRLQQRLHPLPGHDDGQGLCALAHQHQAVQVTRGAGKGKNPPPPHQPPSRRIMQFYFFWFFSFNNIRTGKLSYLGGDLIVDAGMGLFCSYQAPL